MPAGLNRRLARGPDKPGVRAPACTLWRSHAGGLLLTLSVTMMTIARRIHPTIPTVVIARPVSSWRKANATDCFVGSLGSISTPGGYRRADRIACGGIRLCRRALRRLEPRIRRPPEDRQRGHSPDDCERDLVKVDENGTTLELVGCNVLHLTQLGLTMEPSWISSGSLARHGHVSNLDWLHTGACCSGDRYRLESSRSKREAEASNPLGGRNCRVR